MLWRQVDQLVITQPSHAWLAGQLARAWGNDEFAPPVPAEAVCLAAEQHDLGWYDWERMPTLNRRTGKPHFFREVAVSAHVAIWRRGVEMAMALGRYPALLVSLHASGLYGQFDPHPYGHFEPDRAASEDVVLVRDLLATLKRTQERLLARIADDPVYRDAAGPERVARNRTLVTVADRMSIAICSGVVTPTTIGAPGSNDFVLSPIDGDPHHLLVDPWPFRAQTVQLLGEGRALPESYADESSMRSALDAAEVVTIVTNLFPTRRL